MKITMSMMVMMSIIMIMMLITTKMSKKKKSKREKNSSFECGFSQISSPRKSFSLHFFMIAMIFLIFDIEISLILPMFSTKMINLKEWMMFSTMTLMILFMGLVHEWKNGMLEWTN